MSASRLRWTRWTSFSLGYLWPLRAAIRAFVLTLPTETLPSPPFSSSPTNSLCFRTVQNFLTHLHPSLSNLAEVCLRAHLPYRTVDDKRPEDYLTAFCLSKPFQSSLSSAVKSWGVAELTLINSAFNRIWQRMSQACFYNQRKHSRAAAPSLWDLQRGGVGGHKVRRILKSQLTAGQTRCKLGKIL